MTRTVRQGAESLSNMAEWIKSNIDHERWLEAAEECEIIVHAARALKTRILDQQEADNQYRSFVVGK